MSDEVCDVIEYEVDQLLAEAVPSAAGAEIRATELF